MTFLSLRIAVRVWVAAAIVLATEIGGGVVGLEAERVAVGVDVVVVEEKAVGLVAVAAVRYSQK